MLKTPSNRRPVYKELQSDVKCAETNPVDVGEGERHRSGPGSLLQTTFGLLQHLQDQEWWSLMLKAVYAFGCFLAGVLNESDGTWEWEFVVKSLYTFWKFFDKKL